MLKSMHQGLGTTLEVKLLGKTSLELSNFFDPIYERGPDGIPVFKNFIDGSWVESSSRQTFDVRSPIDRNVIARAQKSSKDDVQLAINVAYERGKHAIREIPAIERIEIFEVARGLMKDRKEEIVKTIVVETGKPVKEADGEVRATMERMRLTMQEAKHIYGDYLPGDWADDTTGKVGLVIHEPVGVVGCIGPFNYPLYINAAKIIPALLSGNSVVAKPSSYNPITLLLFARMLEEGGIPRGSINVVTGRGDIGSAIAESDKVGVVSFTGSTEVGKQIQRVAGLKKLHLELGGKAYAIVLKDADLKLAASSCVMGSLRNAGQRCDAVSAILVEQSIADEFVRNVVKEIDKYKIGDPRDPDTTLGAMISEPQVMNVAQLVQDALNKGAKLLKGGNYNGCFFEATVLDHVPKDARILWEETFGPVVVIHRVKDLDEALEIANSSKYGLDMCVFTNDFYTMWKAAKRLQAGEVTINDLPRHGVGFFPFGGIKESGIGREGIGWSIDEMTNLKTIVFNLEPAKLGKVRKVHRM